MFKKILSLFILIVTTVSFFSLSPSALRADIAAASESDYEMLNVPQIRIVTEEGNGTTLQKADGYVNASVSITDTDGSVLEDSVLFKVRGNTTAMETVQKKAFTFKFNKKKNVLGLGSGKKWALLANAFDPTLLRNAIANTIAHNLSLAYTSNQRFVELWVDGSYRGCYGIYEPVQEGKDRVNIDIDSYGGKKDFLIEYEAQREEEDVTYFTVENLRFAAKEPEEPTEAQLDYITGTMEDIIHTLQTGTREEIELKIDLPSFTKYYIMNEYLKTFDFDMSSVFFYYQDGKLYAGPAWDYDLSAGNENDTLNSNRCRKAASVTDIFCSKKNIYRYLCDKSWFNDEVKNVYREYYNLFCDVYADGGMMDRLYEEYKDIFARNYAPGCWKVSRAWINIQKKPFTSYAENYQFMKNWYRDRNLWLTGYFFSADSRRLGDANLDGNVNIMDATAIQRYLVDYYIPVFDAVSADVDRNGRTDILDATAIQRWIADLPISAQGIGSLIEEPEPESETVPVIVEIDGFE